MRRWVVVALLIVPLSACETGGDKGEPASGDGESGSSAGQSGPRLRRSSAQDVMVDAGAGDESEVDDRCRPGTEGCDCLGGGVCYGGLECRGSVCLPKGAAPSPAGQAQSTGSAGSQQRQQGSQPVPDR